MPMDGRDPNSLPSWLTGDPFADENEPEPAREPEAEVESPPSVAVGTSAGPDGYEPGTPAPSAPDSPTPEPIDVDPQNDDVVFAGSGWVAYEGEDLPRELIEVEIDTTPVTPEEMTGIWLTTEYGLDSPVWLDGAPIEPEDLDVSPELADRLRDWADMWNTQWQPDSGWQPRARITDYEALGEWLARRVKDASGAVTVTLQPAHLGRSGIHEIPGPSEREPIVVRLMNEYGRAVPVWTAGDGSFVTEFGVGSFSSEVNARLEAWAEQFLAFMDDQHGWQAPDLARAHANEGRALAGAMQEELGDDYRVELELWELGRGM